MKIEVLEYKEDEGIVTLDIDQEGQRYLLERGFNAMLTEALELLKKEHENGKSTD